MLIITTKDGSHSLFSEQYQEVYHSQNGAIQESQYVFIQAGLNHIPPVFDGKSDTIKIFEVGFGTGLNALLTLIAVQKQNLHVYYETIERYPVLMDIVNQLNYTQIPECENYKHEFQTLHLKSWNTEHTITPHFNFKKNEASLLDFLLLDKYHLIYFDAFGPENQPEMWTLEIMQKLYQALLPGGILVSYCSKVSFQKTLSEAGFTVEKLPGPPGKREMIRAYRRGE